MPTIQPLFLPKPVVEENDLVLGNDFGAEPQQFTCGPDGRLHVLSYLFYNYYRYDNQDSRRGFSTYLVNTYGPDLTPERLTEFTRLKQEIDHDDYLGWDLYHPSLFVTPENRVALTTQANRVFLYDATLETSLGRFAATDPTDKQGMYDQGFACRAERGDDGRLLCLVAEPGVRLKWFAPNLICWSDGTPLEPGQRPSLRCIASLEPNIKVEASFPYVHLADGSRVGKDHRPGPSLEQQVRNRFGLSLYNPWIGQALPLDEGRALLTLFSGHLRGGSKGLEFIFVMLDSDGNLCGRVDEIDRHDESPYVDHHYRLAIDRAHRRIVYKNKTSFFLFDWDGKLLTQVKLDQPNLRPLAAWKLGCCGVDGSIILYQPKQELLLSIDPVSDPITLSLALVEAQEFVKKKRTRLKKCYEAASSRWLHPGPIVRH